jgi:glycerophosphoryl diester phosphodiesterase
VDVRRTADGAFVLMHDRTVDRTTDGSGLVARMTAAAVAGLDAGAWFGATFAGEPVPTLRDALRLARALDMGLITEVKDRSADASWLSDFARLLAEEDMVERCVVSSFDHVQLQLAKRQSSGIRTLGIAHVRAVDAAALVRAAGLDAVVLEFHLHGADDARLLREAGVPVAYSLPRPTELAQHDAYGGDDLSRLEEVLDSDAVSLLVGDDVGWMIDRARSHAR